MGRPWGQEKARYLLLFFISHHHRCHISTSCCITFSKSLQFSRVPPHKLELQRVSALHFQGNTTLLINRHRSPVAFAGEGEYNFEPTDDEPRQRKVVEHIYLIKAKEDMSEKQENDKHAGLSLYTQYQMSGIVAISLGCISDPNPEQYTHAVFMRFQTKEDLAKFYENLFYMKVLNEHVMPYCHGLFNFDYASEVEDDILPIFRKGEEYNYGVELLLLLEFSKSSQGGSAEDAMTSLATLTWQFPSLVVQATTGPNISTSTVDYTHGVVMRFRSSEAFKMFTKSSEYLTVWKSKFQPILEKYLSIHFSVYPIGKELM